MMEVILLAVDPLTAKILAQVAAKAATDSESRKKILFLILAPVLGLLLLIAFILFRAIFLPILITGFNFSNGENIIFYFFISINHRIKFFTWSFYLEIIKFTMPILFYFS